MAWTDAAREAAAQARKSHASNKTDVSHQRAASIARSNKLRAALSAIKPPKPGSYAARQAYIGSLLKK